MWFYYPSTQHLHDDQSNPTDFAPQSRNAENLSVVVTLDLSLNIAGNYFKHYDGKTFILIHP